MKGRDKMFPIIKLDNPGEEEHGVIYHGMNEYAAQYGMGGTGGYFFAVYDTANKIIAAISGFDNFGPAEIGGLWVAEHYRHHGYGKALVSKAEAWGREKGCNAITVFTLKNWPACQFYQKLGFHIEYERPGHAQESIGCYLIKQL